MLLTDASVKNSTTVWVLMVLILVVGAYSYVTLPREAFPDVQIPIILITTPYRGVSPEDVETSITMKIEKELAGLKGVKEIRSASMEGMSSIVVEFHPDVVIEEALQYVRDRVDIAKADLPQSEDRDDPTIKEINVSEIPIMIVNVSGEISPWR
ncbi:MAG TPA: efflux RND transporter permease subunit [Candidatus Brocadiia bacterium]|nr:efflux RND transporter permease subunit [Candidatus Brocadiia bacterium]